MPRFRLLLLALAALLPPFAWAEDWRNLAQPIGTLLIVETAATVNGRLGGLPPFDLPTDVTTIRTTVPQYFVRFYNPTDPVNPSNPVGTWIMRSSEVRGLTRAQVRDKFALPAFPTHMTMVLTPTGFKMYTGIAAPIAGWGSGGGQQSKLIGPPYVPADNFFNQQAIQDCILCYRLLAPSGNANRVAAYLDGRIPAAYSDLETVYTQLDLLYLGTKADQLRSALDQISPARFDNLAAASLRAEVQFNDPVDLRVVDTLGSIRPGRPVHFAGPVTLPAEDGAPGRKYWLRAAGSVQRAGDLGYNASAAGLFAGVDNRVADDLLVGFSAGLAHTDLKWTGPGGGARMNYAKAGIYAARFSGKLFLQGGLSAGLSGGDASRHIAFSDLSRSAVSRPGGWDLNGRLRVGYRLPLDTVNVVPAATLDYFYSHRDGVTERGADSLNLRVKSVRNRTLRSHLGVNVSWDAAQADGSVLSPHLQLGWARERPLDDRAVTAGLDGQTGDFTVYGDTRTTDTLTAGLGFALTRGRHFVLFARYGLEYRRDFSDQTLAAGMDYRF